VNAALAEVESKEGGAHMKAESAHRRRGAMTRRDLLQRSAVTGAATALGAFALGDVREGAAAAGPSPRRGGILKMAWASSPRVIDPALSISGDEYMITGAIYDNLTRIDEKFVAHPQLATGWQPNAHGDIWTFNLRQGVTFHHGKEFTSQDVVFTYERILDPKTGSPGRTAMGPIEKVEPVDAHTVRFTLSEPYADLPVALGWTFGRILPADRASLITVAPSGTGPFKMAEFRPGEYTRMVRFDQYWDRGLPYLNELWQVNIPEVPSQVAALAGGSAQVMFEVPTSYIPVLQRTAGVALVEVKSPGVQPVTMMQPYKPFDDARVRLAMKYLVNRDTLIKTVWQGHATVGEDHPVPSFSPFWAPTSPTHTYDVAKAKSLLAQAGYGGGVNLELWTTNERVGMQELAVGVQQMVAPAGIKVQIKTVPASVLFAEVEKKKPFYCDNWFGRPTIDQTLYPYFHTGAGLNTGGYSNKALDALLDKGRQVVNTQQRKTIYGQAEQIIHEDGPWVVAYFTTYVTAMRNEVKGQVVNPLRLWDFRRTYLAG
jgi:peptide/nickel transport system substrate-binding protein